MPCQFCLSICHTCVKTAERNIEILTLSDGPITLVFRHLGLVCKSDGFTPKRGDEYKGVAIFDYITGYISQMVIGNR